MTRLRTVLDLSRALVNHPHRGQSSATLQAEQSSTTSTTSTTALAA
ncbi:MAG TPA: hypothetical protein VFW09_12940 [Solirubrobacteraceae bacterium]|nr:hypothetical protein [Solirubrobacteraceae bacterium]